MLDPAAVLKSLLSSQPVKLSDLPYDFGIYALFDHAGEARYIGVTESANCGFRNRINSRHVTGSEGRSHKFSHAYNTGRMWRSRTALAAQGPADAKLSKDLRSAFCRRHCSATFVAAPAATKSGPFFAALLSLEAQVKALAPSAMRDWENRQFPPEDEPIELVDALLEELRYTPQMREALNRQAAIFRLSHG